MRTYRGHDQALKQPGEAPRRRSLRSLGSELEPAMLRLEPAWSQNSENIILLIRRDLALLRNCCSALFEGTDDSIFTPAAARHHPLDASMGNWCKFCK